MIRFTEEGVGGRFVEIGSSRAKILFSLSGLLDELDKANTESRVRDLQALADRFDSNYQALVGLLEPSNLTRLSESMERRAVNTFRASFPAEDN